jgi:hypothetical protein
MFKFSSLSALQANNTTIKCHGYKLFGYRSLVQTEKYIQIVTAVSVKDIVNVQMESI